MKILHLTLKKKWFDMILSGEKKEEYREVKTFWFSRLSENNFGLQFKEFDAIHFYNGGSPSLKYPNFKIECLGIEFGKAVPEWSDNWQGEVFVIKLGEIIK
jgi:hypothetical protein